MNSEKKTNCCIYGLVTRYGPQSAQVVEAKSLLEGQFHSALSVWQFKRDFEPAKAATTTIIFVPATLMRF